MGSTWYTYEVRASMADGRDKKLVSLFYALEQALIIEQEIESFLGIEDSPVGGEMDR